MEALQFKEIWTEDDFEVMGWQYATVYAVAVLPDEAQIAFDIDYIFQWIEPKAGTSYYSFMISPATLIFENVHVLNIDLSEPHRPIQIQSIERRHPRVPRNHMFIDRKVEWKWTLDLEVGEITFYSVGYKQIVRKQPIQTGNQGLSMIERGGISFSGLDVKNNVAAR